MNALFETALDWVSKGFSVIPIKYRDKKPSIHTWEPYQTQLPDITILQIWFASRLTNIALITGWNHLVVVDFDQIDVFRFWFSLYPLQTYMVKTSRGIHVYLQVDNPPKNYHSDLLDIKAERGYILIPPSIHPSGAQYVCYQDRPILRIQDLAEVLPAEFTPAPEVVDAGPFHTEQAITSDPWESAEQAIILDADIVNKIRQNQSILGLLPNAERSSRDGRWYVSLCPFHNDHSPSLWIDTKHGLCGCRKCNIKDMDVINLYARLHNVTNQQAIFDLARSL